MSILCVCVCVRGVGFEDIHTWPENLRYSQLLTNTHIYTQCECCVPWPLHCAPVSVCLLQLLLMSTSTVKYSHCHSNEDHQPHTMWPQSWGLMMYCTEISGRVYNVTHTHWFIGETVSQPFTVHVYCLLNHSVNLLCLCVFWLLSLCCCCILSNAHYLGWGQIEFCYSMYSSFLDTGSLYSVSLPLSIWKQLMKIW